MPAKASKPSKRPDWDVLMRFYNRYKHRANFTAVDIGTKWTKGAREETHCLRFHVERKVDASELESTEVMPKTFEGFDVDIIEGDYRQTPEGMAEAANQTRYPYLMGGMSCGRIGPGAGTLGCLVVDEETGTPGLLSNWHVIAGHRAQVGDAITQPALGDQGLVGRDRVAHLSRWVLDRDGDAAFAQLSGERDWLPVVLDDFVPFTGARSSRLGETLRKTGRTTGATEAVVDGEGIYRIRYQVSATHREPRDIVGFKLVPEKPGNPDKIELSEPGDSGSCWYHVNSGKAVGLHFAGETAIDPAAEHAIACDMPRVLGRLKLRMATFQDLLTFASTAQALPSIAIPQPASGAGIPPMFGGMQATGPESSKGTISRNNFVWPNLKAAMAAKDPHFANIEQATTFASLKVEGGIHVWISDAVNEWPAFQALGVRTNPAAFFKWVNFFGATFAVSQEIEAQGYDVI